MPIEIFYDRRDVSATEVQFFHESRMKRPNKELDTNMPLDGMWPYPITVRRILVCVNPRLISTPVARDATIDDEIVRILQDMILELQVGDQPVKWYPLALCLPNGIVTGELNYTLATAADGSYSFMDIKNISGKSGLEIELTVPANTQFKFIIKSLTTPALGKVTAILEVERA